MTAAHICHRCERMTRPGYTCQVDGLPIAAHAQAADCPLGLHASANSEPPAENPAPPPALAGDLMAALANRIGADRVAAWWTRIVGKPCHCAERRIWLNRVHLRLRAWLSRQ